MPTDKPRKPNKAPPAKAKKGLSPNKRINKLFQDIEVPEAQQPGKQTPASTTKPTKKEKMVQPSSTPKAISDAAQMQQELETLRSRVRALEAELQTGRKSTPVLYEKEQVGFAYKGSVLEPLNVLSWKERSGGTNTIRAPLMTTGQAIGDMVVEGASEKSWTPEDEALVQTVAQQASLQIQSLRLLASAERARAEAEEATRRFMHQSWESYMDGIHQNERIGYTYDQASVEPYLDATVTESDHHETVKVMDEQVGTLAIKSDPTRPITDDDKKMVASVANQIAQQVENIRLLADASRARAEAEEATRRLTREGWQALAERRGKGAFGYVYDTIKVAPLEEFAQPENITLTVPLEIQGELVGRLAVAGSTTLSENARDLAAAIASSASTHLETLRLTEELQQRAYELQELDRLKSGFLANMSHELRTPLNSILGFADVMLMELDGPLTEHMNNDLQLIQKNGQHLLHLINDVLDMAKIESGRMNLHPEQFKIHGVLDEVNSITSTLASEKNIALFIEEDSDKDVEIYADNTRVRQVMINLVNNAIKFTEPGGKIAIRAARQNNFMIQISIKDTGIGIPPDQLEDIFQEFTQVDTSTTRKVGGTGLGLPISRRLIEMHGGRLWAESSGIAGEGSTFYVDLPIEARISEVIEKREK